MRDRDNPFSFVPVRLTGYRFHGILLVQKWRFEPDLAPDLAPKKKIECYIVIENTEGAKTMRTATAIY